MIFNHDMLNKLYRYGYALSNNEADAYDLLQDSLTRFLTNKVEGITGDEAVPYLRRMMRNQFIDQLRREKRFPLEALDTIEPQQGDQDEIALERMVISQEILAMIWERLIPLERELVHLWAFEGFNAREISEQLDVPRGTILSRIHRLRKKLDFLRVSVDSQDNKGHSS